MKILMTGSTGFIGRHLRRRLSDEGHELVHLVRNPDEFGDARHGIPIRCDLALAADVDNVLSLLGPVDCIIHLAQANVPFPDGAGELWQVNTNSTLQLLRWARRNGVGRFCLASTGSVYASSFDLLTEKHPVFVGSFYAATKIAAEAAVQPYTKFFRTVVWRLFGPYGPGQTKRLIPTLINRVRNDQPITLNKAATPAMNFLYIDDCVEAMTRSLALDTSAVMNLGGAETMNIKEAALTIGRVLISRPTFTQTDLEAVDCIGDTSRARDLLGWTPRINFFEGIHRTVSS